MNMAEHFALKGPMAEQLPKSLTKHAGLLSGIIGIAAFGSSEKVNSAIAIAFLLLGIARMNQLSCARVMSKKCWMRIVLE